MHHHVTEGSEESVALAVKNGCDINFGNLFAYALQAVQDGLLEESAIDQAVTRLFTTRMRLGLLGAPEQKQYTSIPYDTANRRPTPLAPSVCLLFRRWGDSTAMC